MTETRARLLYALMAVVIMASLFLYVEWHNRIVACEVMCHPWFMIGLDGDTCRCSHTGTAER